LNKLQKKKYFAKIMLQLKNIMIIIITLPNKTLGSFLN